MSNQTQGGLSQLYQQSDGRLYSDAVCLFLPVEINVEVERVGDSREAAVQENHV